LKPEQWGSALKYKGEKSCSKRHDDGGGGGGGDDDDDDDRVEILMDFSTQLGKRLG
jgi:hypothetical protein